MQVLAEAEVLIVVTVFKPDRHEGLSEDTDLKIAFNPPHHPTQFMPSNQEKVSRTPCRELSASTRLSGPFSFQSCILHFTISSILRTHGGANPISLDGCCSRELTLGFEWVPDEFLPYIYIKDPFLSTPVFNRQQNLKSRGL